MNESGVYNERDLQPFHKRIAELRQIIKNDEEGKRDQKAMVKLLERQLKDCGTFSSSSQTSHHPITTPTTLLHRCNPQGVARISQGHFS